MDSVLRVCSDREVAGDSERVVVYTRCGDSKPAYSRDRSLEQANKQSEEAREKEYKRARICQRL